LLKFHVFHSVGSGGGSSRCGGGGGATIRAGGGGGVGQFSGRGGSCVDGGVHVYPGSPISLALALASFLRALRWRVLNKYPPWFHSALVFSLRFIVLPIHSPSLIHFPLLCIYSMGRLGGAMLALLEPRSYCLVLSVAPGLCCCYFVLFFNSLLPIILRCAASYCSRCSLARNMV
jgi:hypothetical protein